MRNETDMPARRQGRRQEGGIERQMGVQTADAVWADDADALPARYFQAAGFEGRSLWPGLAEARSHDDDGVDAASSQASSA